MLGLVDATCGLGAVFGLFGATPAANRAARPCSLLSAYLSLCVPCVGFRLPVASPFGRTAARFRHGHPY
jgi:hypothetical protein